MLYFRHPNMPKKLDWHVVVKVNSQKDLDDFIRCDICYRLYL